MNQGRRIHNLYLVAALWACALYLVLPPSIGAQLLYVAIALSTPLVGALTAGRERGEARIGWWLLVGGFGLAAIGEAAEFIFVTLGVRPSVGAPLDVIFLTAYIVQLCGLMSLFRSRTASRHRFGWFDTAAVGVIVFTVVWSTMYEAIFGRREETPLDLVTRFGGAVLDVALVVMALRLFIAAGRKTGMGFLFAGFVLQMLTDDVAALWPGYRAGGWVDTAWALGYVMIGAAMSHPRRTIEDRSAPTRVARQEIKHTLMLQAVTMAGLAVMVALQLGGHVPLVTLMVWASAWLVVVILTRTRLLGLLEMVGVASATEHERRMTAMVASSNDVIGLADADGTIRYVSPSIERILRIGAGSWIGRRFADALPEHMSGLDELSARCALIAPGEQARWECTLERAPGGSLQTVKLAIANRLDTPELNGWVITATDVTDEARLTSELRHQSLHDTLTGLPNRALLFDRIQHSLDRLSRSSDAQIAVILVDIDDFKSVNDSLGHTTGDELLRAVAQRLTAVVRHGDTVARLGGDEFALLLEGTNDEDALALAHRALDSLVLPVRIGVADYAVRASAGVVCRHGEMEPVELLRSADIAMYASKRSGKGRVTLFEEHMLQSARDELELGMDLRSALDNDELFVVYQPIVDARAGGIGGAEALLRWRHPRRGLVSPGEFISIAEQNGQIRPIGEWVLHTACAEAASWRDAGRDAYVSVNVSAAQLADHRFVDIVIEALERSRLAPQRLMLEITESMLVASHAQAVLARVRALGVRIAIDDFGTGYSSLAYLRELCVDVVKIDQAFVRDLDRNSDHQALTRTILALAEGLDMVAIAEGVETDSEFAELSRLGCPFAQGYLFSRPMARDALREFFEIAPPASGARPTTSPLISRA